MVDEITRDIKDKNKITVLFVDDEMMVLKSLRRALRNESFNKIYVNDPRKVMEIFEREEIGVIVTDMKMPHMDGLKLLKMIKEVYPDTVKIVLSGYTQLPQVLAALNHGELYKFITKPWNMEDEFLPVLYEAINKYKKLLERRKMSFNVIQKNQMYKKMLDLSKIKEINFQTEITRIKEINELMMQQLKEKASKESIDILRQIENYEICYDAWFYSVPRSDTEFTISQLENDIEKILSKKNQSMIINGLSEEAKKDVLVGDYRLLMGSLLGIDEMTTKTCKEDYEKHSVVAKIIDQEATKVLILMKRLNFISRNDKLLMEDFSKVMNEVVSSLGGGFEILRVETQYYYRFTTYFSVKR